MSGYTAMTVALVLVVLVVMSTLLFGCASVKVKQLKNGDEYKDGVRFYRPAPYFWVTLDENNKLQTTLVWLPDKSEEYVIRKEGFWGSANMEVTLENGWNLTKLGTASDSKGPETIAAVAGALGVFTEAMGILPEAQKFPMPGLYRIQFDENGHIAGLVKANTNLIDKPASEEKGDY